MTARGHLTQKQKEALLAQQDNRCATCGEKLISGLFEFDHTQDLQFDGDNALDNWKALCTAPPYRCHQSKTARASKAKSHAVRVRVGKPHKSIWKRKLSGEVVRRS